MSLVEVLVALVSACVGLLGVAALQLTSLRANQQAYVRAQASALATAMLDRIRANPQGLTDGGYDEVHFNDVETSEARASNDLRTWQFDIDRQLPGGTDIAAGAIHRNTQSNVVTVTLRWAQQNAASTNGAATLSLSTEI
jgi:type IV pilus assembly protein PilV